MCSQAVRARRAIERRGFTSKQATHPRKTLSRGSVPARAELHCSALLLVKRLQKTICKSVHARTHAHAAADSHAQVVMNMDGKVVVVHGQVSAGAGGFSLSAVRCFEAAGTHRR